MPFAAPTAAPASTMARITKGAESIARNTRPPTTVARARLAPTDRSMPRVRMTRCWPIATMAITAVCAAMLPRLPGLRKFGVSRPITATRATRISTGPMLRSRSPRDSNEVVPWPAPALGELERMSACSVITAATAAPPYGPMLLIDKKQEAKAGQLVIYALRDSRSLGTGRMKTDAIFKRAFNDALDLVQALKDGDPLP